MNLLSISSGNAYPTQNRAVIRHDRQSYRPECDYQNNRACTTSSFSNDSKVNESSSFRRDLPEFWRESLYPDLSISQFRDAADGHNSFSAECLTDTNISSMGYNSDVQMNCGLPRYGTSSGYPLKVHGAEAKKFRTGMPPVDGKYSSPGRVTSAFPHSDNFGATIIEQEQDINVIPFPNRPPHNVDGSFLTLGTGGGREIISNNNFNPREIASRLEEDTASVQYNSSHVGQILQNPLNLNELTGSSSRIQSNSGGLSRPSYMLPPSMSIQDEHFQYFSVSQNSDQLSLATHAIAQPTFSGRYNNYVPDPSTLSFPLRSPPAYFSGQSRQVFMNGPPGFLQYSSNFYGGSSFNHAQLGQYIIPSDGRGTISSAGVHFQPRGNVTSLAGNTRTEVTPLGSSSVQPIGNLITSQDGQPVHFHSNSSYPVRIGYPVPSWTPVHSSAASQFPKRLGVQPNDFPTPQIVNDQFQRPVRPQYFGPLPTNMMPTIRRPSPALSSGQQYHCIPAHFGQMPQVSTFDPRPQPPSPGVPRPSLKRPATENPQAIQLSRRRKGIPARGRGVLSSDIHNRPLAIAAPAPGTVRSPSSPHHIKWKGVEEMVNLTGCKCHLCKRDLSLTAEGPAYQPTIPPPAAVLPCGHTFHDDCLQKITPQDQSKDPPCIPCAIGEEN
ncbi:uncharacterized protein LOC127254812 isoform X2 [Andrographis paniculata]|nr:uncharacterized protein LOC127254812 isoform X2 [Andrographis paniculata]